MSFELVAAFGVAALVVVGIVALYGRAQRKRGGAEAHREIHEAAEGRREEADAVQAEPLDGRATDDLERWRRARGVRDPSDS